MNGRIGLYQSLSYIGDYAGTRGMINNRDGTMSRYTEDMLQIQEASRWLQENNRMFLDKPLIVDTGLDSTVPELIHTQLQGVQENLFMLLGKELLLWAT